jgi:hypothetical protein
MLPRDYQSFTLIGEYEPIRADQKFFISDTELDLVIDYETPQYNLGGLSRSIISLPLTELGGAGADAITHFALPDDEAAVLYATGEPLERMLFMHTASILKPAPDSTIASHTQNEIDDGIILERMISGAYETTPAFERLLTDMSAIRDIEKDELISQRDRMRQAGGEYADESVYASLTIDFMHLGNVFTTFRFLYANIYIPSADGGDDQELRYYREERNSFDAESLAPLGPAEIFAEGFDYEQLFGEALDREMAKPSAGQPAITPPREERERLLKTMLANGVFLDRSGMMLCAPPVDGDPGGQSYYPRIDYADIGYENLRIFD